MAALCAAAVAALGAAGCGSSDSAPPTEFRQVRAVDVGVTSRVARAMGSAGMEQYLVVSLSKPGDWRSARAGRFVGAVVIGDPTVADRHRSVALLDDAGTGLRFAYSKERPSAKREALRRQLSRQLASQAAKTAKAAQLRKRLRQLEAPLELSMLLANQDGDVIGTASENGEAFSEQVDLDGDRVADVSNVITPESQRLMFTGRGLWLLDEMMAGLGSLCSARAMAPEVSELSFDAPSADAVLPNDCLREFDTDAAGAVGAGASVPPAAGAIFQECKGGALDPTRRDQVASGGQRMRRDLHVAEQAYINAIDSAYDQYEADLEAGYLAADRSFRDDLRWVTDVDTIGGVANRLVYMTFSRFSGDDGMLEAEIGSRQRDLIKLEAATKLNAKLRDAKLEYEKALNEVIEDAEKGRYNDSDNPPEGDDGDDDDDTGPATDALPGEEWDPEAARDRLCRYRGKGLGGWTLEDIEKGMEGQEVVDNRCDDPVTQGNTGESGEKLVLCPPDDDGSGSGLTSGLGGESCETPSEVPRCEPWWLKGEGPAGSRARVSVALLDTFIVTPCPPETCRPREG